MALIVARRARLGYARCRARPAEPHAGSADARATLSRRLSAFHEWPHRRDDSLLSQGRCGRSRRDFVPVHGPALRAPVFRRRHAARSGAARSRINLLWDDVEWNWFTQGGREVLYWHWSPNNGWAMDHEIQRLERVPHHLRARGRIAALCDRPDGLSPRVRRGPRFPATASRYYGIELPLGMPYGGPLFFAHYSFCGLDPRGLKDRYADYWEQNVRHVRINRAHCVAQSAQATRVTGELLGAHRERRSGRLFARMPRQRQRHRSRRRPRSRACPMRRARRMQVLRHLLARHGERVWGRYGFVDAFCESARLVRRHLSRDRSGADHPDDRELPHAAFCGSCS